MKKIIFVVLSVLGIVGAISLFSHGKGGTKHTAVEIDTIFSSGVVLVQNQYYYTAEFGELTFYFTGIDDEGGLENSTTDKDDITIATSYGTGFFVSKDGKVVTNSHVASPEIDEDVVKENIGDLKNFLKALIETEITNYTDTINQLHNIWLLTESGSYEERRVEMAKRRCEEERSELQETLYNINSLNASKINMTLHSKIGIAYNNTFITNTTDFEECVLVADDKEHDLAVIQLKSKKSPADCAVFDTNKYEQETDGAPYDENGEYIDIDNTPTGTKLFMIAFNLGPNLALTKDGIKAQINEGSITQNTDNVKMMYNIPSLHGSSGSPVIDEYGNLIAINFAGLDMTQGFNYGIKVKHLRNLLEK